MGDDGDDGYKGSVGKAAAGAGDSEAGTAGGGGTEGVMNEFNFLQNPDGVDCVKTEDKGRKYLWRWERKRGAKKPWYIHSS